MTTSWGSGGQMPPPRRTPDDVAELLRLDRYRDAHPEVVIADIGFGAIWQARIPEPRGESVITRHLLRDLLDRLDGLDEPGPPDSG